MSRVARILALGAGSVAAAVAGCSQGPTDAAPPVGADMALDCVDADGDGFGSRCAAGADCDDGDSAITDACYRCAHPGPGCPCSNEGEKTVCGQVESEVAGQITCGLGQSTCAQAMWGPCVVDNSVTLAKQPPSSKPQDFGPSTTCTTNPCDPYCKEYVDTPTGIDQSDGGVVATDAGVTLPGNGGGEPSPICTSGVSGTCAHSICVAGTALSAGCDAVPGATVTLYRETFAHASGGWTLGTEWTIGRAKSSSGHTLGNGDPSLDATPTADEGLAGMVIGGNTSQSNHAYYYLTSPKVDLSTTGSPVTLKFKRWLNTDAPAKMTATVEVYNGGSWVSVWTNSAAVIDNAWQAITYDVSAYKNATFQVRFGIKVTSSPAKVSGWNVDDVEITGTIPTPNSCVTQVCAASPSCCSAGWQSSCVAQVETVCGLTCGSIGGVCAVCYQDGLDHDGDGYSYQQGDCKDCDVNVNPGAFDVAGNGVDEDCTGVADDEPANCDSGLALASSDPFDHAKAIDLCRKADPLATGNAKHWGVLDAKLVQADGTSVPHSMSYGILTKFGPNNVPQLGSSMAAYSSGTAREPGSPGYVNPNGQYASFNQNKACNYPAGFPKNAGGCPNGTASAYDSTGLRLAIRAPTNAKSMSYRFNFFSSEYPEWVCTAYNDGFVALLYSGYLPANAAANSNNISFDSVNNPVSVNIGFFTVTSGPKLAGTGMDGLCGGSICGGGTDWLETTSPVSPGETLAVQFAIWDTGDHVWDSIVLVDDWQWSVNPATIETKKPSEPPPTTYSDGWFVRDYDATGACGAGQSLVWSVWSWNASTPSDSKLEFYVATAATQAGLASAQEDALQFTDPPGPAALDGQPAVAKAGVPDTQGGSAPVDATLVANNRPTDKPFLRVRTHLVPSTDKLSAPTLMSWNLQTSCVFSE